MGAHSVSWVPCEPWGPAGPGGDAPAARAAAMGAEVGGGWAAGAVMTGAAGGGLRG